MKKSKLLLTIINSCLISSSASFLATSCANLTLYVPIPTGYFNLVDNGATLDGFKKDLIKEEIKNYDTLQVPDSVITVIGFNYLGGYKSYESIKNIIGNDLGRWAIIPNKAFVDLPALEKIIFPKTITNIADGAFVNLYNLNTIDFSNIPNLSIIKSDQFICKNPELAVKKGTIIVKNNNDKETITNIIKFNDWLKEWTIKVK